jgi:hypothetical protein
VILQHLTARDDRAGDLDLVERQDVDQGRRCPGSVSQALRQALANIALGFDDQSHEDRIEQALDIGIGWGTSGLASFAKFNDASEQPFAIARIAAARQCQKLGGLDGLDDQPPRIPNCVRMTLLSANENMLKQGGSTRDKSSGELSRVKLEGGRREDG